MEFDELLQHLADLRDLAASEGFIQYADSLDDVVMFVEARPERFERRWILAPAAKPPIEIVVRNDLAHFAGAAARDEAIAEEMDRVVADLERERRSRILPKRRD